MKKITTYIMAAIVSLAFSVTASAEIKFETKDLAKDRSGMEFAAQINALDSKINGAKWSDGNGVGYIFKMKDNPMRGMDQINGDKIFFDVLKFAYRTEIKDSEYYARQSERVGYVELYGVQDPSSTLHLKLIDKDTLELFFNARESREKERVILKRVNQFQENTSTKKLESAEESGVWF